MILEDVKCGLDTLVGLGDLCPVDMWRNKTLVARCKRGGSVGTQMVLRRWKRRRPADVKSFTPHLRPRTQLSPGRTVLVQKCLPPSRHSSPPPSSPPSQTTHRQRTTPAGTPTTTTTTATRLRTEIAIPLRRPIIDRWPSTSGASRRRKEDLVR